jgi:hypothetical protein
LIVGGLEPGRQLDANRQHLTLGSRARAIFVERHARHELHYEHVDALERIEVVDDGDVRVVQTREGTRFLTESPSGRVARRKRRREHLDGHLPVEMPVVGAVDEAHAASPDLFEDAIVAEDLPRRHAECRIAELLRLGEFAEGYRLRAYDGIH